MFEYIGELSGWWQVAAYLFLSLFIIGILRIIPIMFEIIWNMIVELSSITVKGAGYGIFYLLRWMIKQLVILGQLVFGKLAKIREYDVSDKNKFIAPETYTKMLARGNSYLNQYEPKTPEEKPDDDDFKELNDLIGLETVKKQIKMFCNMVQVQKARKKKGLPTTNVSYHLVFAGNPGTGKTTVARMVGRIFKKYGVLRKGHLIETNRSGLVSDHLGATAPLVNEVVDKAMNGLLFIDEAYTLTTKDDREIFGAEAVAQLLVRMENDRDRLVVIVAGYPEEMGRFINSNPGLRSRFSTFMMFEDYNPPELLAIFLKICKGNTYTLGPLAEKRLAPLIEQIWNERGKGFGNGRAMRNLFEQCLGLQAKRIAEMSDVSISNATTEDLITFRREDIPEISELNI